MERLQQERAAEAGYCPFTAIATRVAILVVNASPPNTGVAEQEELVQFDIEAGTSPRVLGFAALQYMSEKLGYLNDTIAMRPFTETSVRSVPIFGLRIQEKLQLLAADAMRYAAAVEMGNDIAPELWYHLPMQTSIWCDPYNVIVPADQRQWVKYEQLAEFLGLQPPSPELESDPVGQARFAKLLAKAANLY